MANNIATPLERQFMQINGLELVTSQEHAGQRAASRSSSRSTRASTPPRPTCRRRSRRPPAASRSTCPSPPTFSKTNPNDQPIMYIALTSDSVTPGQLYDYASTQVGQRISILPGVSRVQRLRHQVGDPHQGRSVRDVRRAASRWTTSPTAIQQRHQLHRRGPARRRRPARRCSGRRASSRRAEHYSNLIVGSTRRRAGLPARRRARSTDSVQDERINMRFWVRGYDGARRPPSSSPSTARPAPTRWRWPRASATCCPMISAELPGSVRITPIYDRSQIHRQLGRTTCRRRCSSRSSWS